jgi:hypothetical protein
MSMLSPHMSHAPRVGGSSKRSRPDIWSRGMMGPRKTILNNPAKLQRQYT